MANRNDRRSVRARASTVGGLTRVADRPARHGIAEFTTALDAALADETASIYFDAQVTSERKKAILKALAAGKHVYTEKPLAETVDEGLADHLELAPLSEQGLAELVELARAAAGVDWEDREEELFGPEVAHVVEGVTKLSGLQFASSEERQAESFRKMLMAMVDDIRVILVKLADRLHNMRTLQYLNPEKRKRIAE